MYNTQFDVKYNYIETELIEKLNNKETTDYNLEDVSDICSKLYRDELMTVFDVHFILDDKLDQGMKNIYKIMIKNEKFKQITDDLINAYLLEFIQTKERGEEEEEGEEGEDEILTQKQEVKNFEQLQQVRQLVLLILFSQNIFYITHKCICQQMEQCTINDDLLVILKQKSTELLLSNYC
jgi:hypothetical protein